MNVETVKKWFPKDLEEKLEFMDEGNFVTVRGKHFLPGETFTKVSAIVREHGGEYISQGKLSHFRIQKFEKPSHQSRDILDKDALAYLESVRDQLNSVLAQIDFAIEKLKETQK